MQYEIHADTTFAVRRLAITPQGVVYTRSIGQPLHVLYPDITAVLVSSTDMLTIHAKGEIMRLGLKPEHQPALQAMLGYLKAAVPEAEDALEATFSEHPPELPPEEPVRQPGGLKEVKFAPMSAQELAARRQPPPGAQNIPEPSKLGQVSPRIGSKPVSLGVEGSPQPKAQPDHEAMLMERRARQYDLPPSAPPIPKPAADSPSGPISAAEIIKRRQAREES
ncbi:MAG: hypothetical protein AB7S38_08265 [Vulcanimicrobiota bacterium]